MVRILSVATVAFALFSTAHVIAHPTFNAAHHHAIAQRANTSKTTAKTTAKSTTSKTTSKTTAKTTSKTTAKTTAKSTAKITTSKTTAKTTTTKTTTKTTPKTTTTTKTTTKTTPKTTTTSKTTSKTTTTSLHTTTTTTTSKTTSKTTTKASTTTASSQTPIGLGLLPVSGALAGWTVGGASSSPVSSLVLTNDLFTMVKAMSLPHEVVAVDGKNAIHGHVSAGSVALDSTFPLGGFSFYTPGPKGTTVDLTKACEVSMGYSVKFSDGYAWNMGGKLPGLYGGTDKDTAATCSGGKHSDGCFSCRYMWRENGQGELYLYLPPDLNRANLCGQNGDEYCPITSDDGTVYGATVGTGSFYFEAGGWTSVRQVVHLNTPGQQDGWIQIYVNGGSTPTINVQGLAFRGAQGYFYGIQTQYFHGGHEANWAAPQDQDAWFADFSVAVTQWCS